MTIPQARGSASQVVIDFETQFGVDPSTKVGIVIPFNYPWELKATRKLTDANNTNRGSAQRSSAMPFYGVWDLKGSPTVPIDEVAFGYWLRALLGAPTTTGSSPLYTHVFKPAAAIESMVIDQGYTDIVQYIKANGVKLNKLTFDVKPEGELTAKLELIGAKQSAGASAYDSTPDTLTFSRFHQMQAALQEGGSAIAYVQEITGLEIDNNLDDKSYAVDGSGGFRGALNEGITTVSGKLKAFFKDLVLYNKAINGTESSLKIVFTSGTHSLEFLIGELLYEPDTPTITAGGIYIDLAFKGYYENGADAAAIKVTLINNYADYTP